MSGNTFELDKEIYELKDKLFEVKKGMLTLLQQKIEIEDQLLALEEERFYLVAGEGADKMIAKCRGHCRGKNAR